MKYLILVILLFIVNVIAKDITPYRYVTASEAVSDFVKVGNTLIIATEEGVIDIYDLNKDKLVDQIVLQKHKDMFGDDIRSLIVSVDYFEGKLLFIVHLFSTFREFYIYENKKLTKLIDESQHLTLQEVKFVDENRAIINTMGNELILYDLKNRNILYKK